MPRNRFVLVVALLTGAAGCSSPLDVSTKTAALAFVLDSTGPSTIRVAADTVEDEACPAHRLVLKKDAPGCSDPAITGVGGAWTFSSLFPGTFGELGRYCVVQWAPTTVAADYAALHAAFTTVPPYAQDCEVVAAQGAPVGPTRLEGAFLDQVSHAPPVAVNPAAVRKIPVAVIDSAVRTRDRLALRDRSGHGRAMQAIIHRLACPEPNDPSVLCAVRPHSTLALPRRVHAGQIVEDVSHGGYFGSFTDVARAVHDALRDMPGPRRILNLSLGWSARYGGPPGARGPATDAVLDILRYASCTGAVSFASAGNGAGGPPSALGVGPTYPGGWAEELAPTRLECQRDFLITPTYPTPPGAPLLVAVGAVDGADLPLHNAREGARAELVAPSQHVSITRASVAIPAHTPPYTGTSISAAVASSAAAMLWALKPGLSSHAVPEVLMSRAVTLGRGGIDFGTGLRRIPGRLSMCSVVQSACQSNAACTVTPSCRSRAAYTDHRIPDYPRPPANRRVDARGLWGAVTHASACGSTGWRRVDLVPLEAYDPCPAQQLYGVVEAPWAYPHPDVPVCSVCEWRGASLGMKIDHRLQGALTDPTLSAKLASGDEVRHLLPVPLTELVAGAYLEVHDLPISSHDVVGASIDFVVDGKMSSTDPVVVVH
jgi:hypothetical protein